MVLVVDDDLTFLREVEQSLTAAGIPVLPAATGAAALAAVRSIREIQLVVLDLDLPDIPGMPLMVEMREVRPDLKIIAMTGLLTKHALVIAQYLGAETVLKKPVTKEWLSTIRHARDRAMGEGS